MRKTPKAEQFILLPLRGIRAAGMAGPQVDFLSSLSAGKEFAVKKTKVGFKVLDAIHENGAKLVEVSHEAIAAFKAEHAGLRLVPIRYFYPMVAEPMRLEHKLRPATFKSTVTFEVLVQSAADLSPIRGATVQVLTDVAGREGVSAATNKSGVALIKLPLGTAVELVYVERDGFFGKFKKNPAVTSSGLSIKLVPVLGYADALRHFYSPGAPTDGAGIRVGVIDTGVGPHPDLRVAGGRNTVVGESSADFADNGLGHGCHVGGIVGARGKPGGGVRGIAPGVDLHSYRVFGKGEERASNYAIAKAIDSAVSDGCHLINMSLGGGPSDDATRDAIEDARERGSVLVAACGNEARSPVSWPARHPLVLAVSAFGRDGTFPKDALQAMQKSFPKGQDPKNWMAKFSNVGVETDLTAPGVGIVSTIPGGYAAWDGTSMATPAACARIAVMWSRDQGLKSLQADADRANKVISAVLSQAKALGFGTQYEGNGLLK